MIELCTRQFLELLVQSSTVGLQYLSSYRMMRWHYRTNTVSLHYLLIPTFLYGGSAHLVTFHVSDPKL